MTAACGRGCASSVGQRQSKRKGNRQKKNTVDGDTGNDKGDVCGGEGEGGRVTVMSYTLVAE